MYCFFFAFSIIKFQNDFNLMFLLFWHYILFIRVLFAGPLVLLRIALKAPRISAYFLRLHSACSTAEGCLRVWLGTSLIWSLHRASDVITITQSQERSFSQACFEILLSIMMLQTHFEIFELIIHSQTMEHYSRTTIFETHNYFILVTILILDEQFTQPISINISVPYSHTL